MRTFAQRWLCSTQLSSFWCHTRIMLLMVVYAKPPTVQQNILLQIEIKEKPAVNAFKPTESIE